jgi:hypothetical protein
MPAAWYEDTDPEALEVFLQLHRRMTTGQRVARVFELTAFQESLQRAFGALDVSASRRTRSISAGGRAPAGSRDDDSSVRLGSGPASVTALAQAFQELLAALDRTETPFVVVGSVASGAHGLAPLTNDIDIVVDLPAERVPAELCEELAPAFYADAAWCRAPWRRDVLQSHSSGERL